MGYIARIIKLRAFEYQLAHDQRSTDQDRPTDQDELARRLARIDSRRAEAIRLSTMHR